MSPSRVRPVFDVCPREVDFFPAAPRNGEHPSSADTVRECPSTTGYWSRLRYYAITEARTSDENEAIGDSRESKQGGAEFRQGLACLGTVITRGYVDTPKKVSVFWPHVRRSQDSA